MSGESPPNLFLADQAQKPQPEVEYGEQQALEYLAERDLESLAGMTVFAHGETMTLTQAFTSCPEARSSLESTIETLEKVGIKGEALATVMTDHVATMAEKSRSPDVMAAKKKVS